MDAANIADLFSEALFIVVVIVTVIIGPSLIIGLIVATFQAATQTLSFLPRLLVTLMVLIVTGPWIVGKVVDFTNTIIFNIPILIG